jgi:hypothetical protein
MRTSASIAFVLALIPFAARSQYEQDFGNVIAHYNALPTEHLLPAMAKSYGVGRARDQGLVIIAVERKGSEKVTIPVRATLEGSATSMSGQTAALKFREIAEDGAVSYISQFPISAPDTYRFTVVITPEGATSPYTLKFTQDFVGD